MGRYLTRWLIPLPAILFAVAPQNANAEPVLGLATTYYAIDVIPPVQSTSEYSVCGTETENNINRSYDGEPYEDCTGDLFMVHMTGFITIPEHNTIEFWLASDDGGEITIDDNTFGVWNDQGCSATLSGELELEVSSVPLELWMYENGGGTCVMLAWKIDDGDWTIVPDEAFTTSSSPTITTTTTTTTTTSTLPETTTTTSTTSSTSSSTTTLPQQNSTTTSTTLAPTTTQMTTTTTVPATTTTTTEAPYVPTQTTSTTEPEETTTTEPLEEATTTTTEAEKEEETSTTYPDETTIPETTVPEIFDEPVLDEVEQPQEEEMLLEDTPDTTVLEEKVSLSDIISDGLLSDTISDEQFEEILDNLEDASPEQVATIIESILAADITSEQAAELVSNVAILQVISKEDAEQLFSEVVPADLTEEQAALIVEAVQAAPIEVRQAFEGVIDIFGSQFENYVPTGSNIPVSTRRTLVAIGATLTMLPTSRVKR